ncbi:hypothetical protein [Facilibium subflavum]|uniref:hypothetical protein n=1 Tax=Facilibium subflavum TaxID=2219058 RepID=UPI000E6522DB|nr:hypothetical protein [Facilibium subflavum]
MKNTNKKVDQILSQKNAQKLSFISNHYKQACDADRALKSFDVPYFKYIHVNFFDGEKLLLSTEIPELLAKFRELNKPLIELLKTHPHFANLQTMTLKLYFKPHKPVKDNAHQLSKAAKEAFKSLANTLENDQIKQSIHRLIDKPDK